MNRFDTPRITKKEITKRFNISLSTIDRAMQKGMISYSRVGDRSIRFTEDDISRFITTYSAGINKEN